MTISEDRFAGPAEPANVRRSAPPWRGRPVVVATVAATLVLSVVVALRYQPGDSAVVRSDAERTAPAFAVPDLGDETATVALEQFRGRPVVLNFWASWCVPCRKEMPAFEAVHERVGNRVAFLGMNNQDSRGDALRLLRTTKVSYPSGYDPAGRVAKAYSLRGMPTTVFISAQGRILATRTGQVSERQLADSVRDLFGVTETDG